MQLLISGSRFPTAEQIGCGFWIYLLVQFFPNHAYWRGVATGQTFYEFNTVIPVGADRDGMMHFFPISRPLDSERRAQIFH